MAEKFVIRDMRAEDRPAVERFMAGLNDFEMKLSPDRAPGEEIAEAHVDFLLDEVARLNGFTLIAEVDGKAAGFLLGYIDSLGDGDIHLREEFRRSGHISDVFVDPAYRRRGLTRAMLDEAERRFKSKGLAWMDLSFVDANDGAEKAYRAAGFAPYERIFVKPL